MKQLRDQATHCCNQEGRKSLLTKLTLSVLVVFIAACTTSPARDATVLSVVRVNQDSACITFSAITLCSDREKLRHSVSWRIFDPTDEGRQQLVYGRMLEVNGWARESVRQTSDSSKLSLLWQKSLRAILDSESSQVFAAIPLDQLQLKVLRHLGAAPIDPFIRINLASGDVTVDQSRISAWVAWIKSDPFLENTCTDTSGMAPPHPIPCSQLLHQYLTNLDIAKEIGDFLRTESAKGLQLISNGLLIHQQYSEWLATVPRQVYLVDGYKSSPQVDILGNLYFPSELLTSESDTDIGIILTHEAAHVAAIELDQVILELWQFLSQTNEASTLKEDLGTAAYRMMSAIRLPDEMYVDLLATTIFRMSAAQMSDYANLVQRFEPALASRARGLAALADWQRHGMSVDLLLHARQSWLYQDCDHQIKQDNYFSNRDVKPSKGALEALERYQLALAHYESRLTAQRLIVVSNSQLDADEATIAQSIFTNVQSSPVGCYVAILRLKNSSGIALRTSVLFAK